MSSSNGNHPMRNLAKLMEKRNGFIDVTLGMAQAVKLYNTYVLCRVSPTKRRSRGATRRLSSTRNAFWGTTRKSSAKKVSRDTADKTTASTRSKAHLNSSTSDRITKMRYKKPKSRYVMPEEVDLLVLMMEERCQIEVDLSKPYHVPVQSLRSIRRSYGSES